MSVDDKDVRCRVYGNAKHRRCDERGCRGLLVRAFKILAEPEPRDVVVRRDTVVNARERRERRKDADDCDSGHAVAQGTHVS